MNLTLFLYAVALLFTNLWNLVSFYLKMYVSKFFFSFWSHFYLLNLFQNQAIIKVNEFAFCQIIYLIKLLFSNVVTIFVFFFFFHFFLKLQNMVLFHLEINLIIFSFQSIWNMRVTKDKHMNYLGHDMPMYCFQRCICERQIGRASCRERV